MIANVTEIQQARLDALGYEAANSWREAERCRLEGITLQAREVEHRAALARACVEAHSYCAARGSFRAWLEKHGIPRSTAYLYVQEKREPEVRERKNASERKRYSKQSTGSKPVDTSPGELIQEQFPECRTPAERWEWSAMSLAGDVLSAAAYWQKTFGDWEQFAPSSELRTLMGGAAAELQRIISALHKASEGKA